MASVTKEEKKGLRQKLLEFRRTGLVAYAQYLANELEASEGKEIRKAYTKYLKKEITSTAKKIARVETKLSKEK